MSCFLPWILFIITVISFIIWFVYLKKSEEKSKLSTKKEKTIFELYDKKRTFEKDIINIKAKLEELDNYKNQNAFGWSIEKLDYFENVLHSEIDFVQERISEIDNKISELENNILTHLNSHNGTQFSYDWLDEIITNTKQKHQNAVETIKIIDSCNITQSYQQGSISEEIYNQLLKTYKNLQYVIKSTPKTLIVLENKRFEILKSNKKNERCHIDIAYDAFNDPELNDAELCKKRFNHIKNITLDLMNTDIAKLEATANSYMEYILENSTIPEQKSTVANYQAELSKVKDEIKHLKFVIEDEIELEEFCITKLCEEYGYYDFKIYKMLYSNFKNTDIQNEEKGKLTHPTTENKNRETELEKIENSIANLKQMIQNAIRDIGDVKPEDVEQAYNQGLINKDKFEELCNSYKCLQAIISLTPRTIEILEQQRLEILNKK